MNNKLHPVTAVCLMLGIIVLSLGFHRLNIKRIVRRETKATVVLSQLVKDKSGRSQVALMVEFKVRGSIRRLRKYISFPRHLNSVISARAVLKELKEGTQIIISYNENSLIDWLIISPSLNRIDARHQPLN